MDDEIAYLNAHTLRDMVKEKQLSAVEITQHFLRRIELYNDEFHAYDWVIPEKAMEDARQVDQWVAEGNTDLQLLGVPTIVDGAMHIEGLPLSYGCIVDVDEISKADSNDVKVLREAGAIILGKGNSSEFGLTASTISSISPEAKNPHNTLYSTGGANGGVAAALAKGLATVGIGPDKNGGMRLPASYCGLTSIKPTRGRVPFVREFLLSIINKALTQVCPMGRCVTDVAMILNTLAQEEKGDHERLRVGHDNYEEVCHEPPPDLRIGWIPQFANIPVDNDVAEICEYSIKLLRSSGHRIEPVEFDIGIDIFKDYCNVFSCEHYVPIVTLCELDKCGACDHLMRGTHRWLNYAKTVSGVGVSAGVNQFSVVREKFSQMLRQYDLLITPASVVTPLSLEDLKEENLVDGCFKYSIQALSNLLLSNLTGHPSLVLPAGVNVQGLPIGINVISKYCSEDLLFKFANSFEETFKLHGKISYV